MAFMHKLAQGIHKFQTEVFVSRKNLFERLARAQRPEVLFITCSDSRVNPNLVTQTEPGELFIIRNAGNIIPAYGVSRGGEEAAIEFAVASLGVKDIIICGHSHCGAMQALLNPHLLDGLPAMTRWLEHAESTRRIIAENYAQLPSAERLNVAIQENVIMQLEALRTHPSVAARLARKSLELHGWVYKFETGEVFSYDTTLGQFKPITPVSERREARAAS